MKDYKTLIVWQKSHSFTLDIYKLTEKLPQSELFGLTSQIRRSSSSIPTNIAEGCGRGSDKDFARFIQIAMGSASETSYLILLISDLEYIEKVTANNMIEKADEIMKMLTSLIKILKL